MNQRILVYGFGPYRGFRKNVTERIIKSLRPRSGLKKRIFAVLFHRGQFVDALRYFQPDIVLGLGQSSRRGIEIESRGVNHRRANRSAKRSAILAMGPRQLGTTLKIKAGRSARISRNAGDYVCNYSIYVMLHAIRQQKLTARFGFVHIPHDYDEAKARRFVERVLRQCRRQGKIHNVGLAVGGVPRTRAIRIAAVGS
jgi:pyroglutamyl-peptidase